MLTSPTWTGGGGSRREDKEVDCEPCSGDERLDWEPFKPRPEDMRLNSFVVRESFFPFLSSRFSSSPSGL